MHSLRIGDILIHSTTVAGQLVLARMYFARRKGWEAKGGSARRLSRLMLAGLVFFWICCTFNIASQTLRLHVAAWIPAWIRGIAYDTGTTWGITSAASLALYFLTRLALKRPVTTFSSSRRSLVRSAGLAAVSAPFAAVAFGGIIERTDFHVKEIDLPVPDLHPDLEGFRIVQISDLHVSPFLSVGDAGRVVDMANELRAHLAVVTGDLISEAGDPLDATIRELARLRADSGVLGCMGNHEQLARCQNYATREAAKYGIQFLRQQARQVRRGAGVLNIAGVDYQSVQDKAAYLLGAERLIVPGSANLLLSHNPDVFPVAVRQGYDAVLAGHTHGGQVTIEILNQTANFARFVTRYVCGLYRIDGRSCYVTPGIGTIGMPVRLGAPPEVSLLRLRKA